MKYTKEERIDIGRQVYTHEISHKEAMVVYGIVSSCVDRYVQDYKRANGIPFKEAATSDLRILKPTTNPDIETYMAMSKEQLINELILAKVNEARAKKGYEVKGVGANKEFISLNNKNSKS